MDYSSYQHLLIEKKDGIALLTINRPESLNSTNFRLHYELSKVWLNIAEDDEVRVALITGAGRAFSAGGDFEVVEKAQGNAEVVGQIMKEARDIVHNMINCDKPIISAINGVAVGAGCNMALATDLRIASDAARFGEVFTRVGLVPDGGGTYFLPRLVGTAKAMELMLLAEIIDAQEALRLGLVNWVVPADTLQDETQKLAERLAQGPTLAYGLVKTGLYQGLTMPLEDVLNMEARNQTMAARSQDRAEGVTAFREKRQPRFLGR